LVSPWPLLCRSGMCALAFFCDCAPCDHLEPLGTHKLLCPESRRLINLGSVCHLFLTPRSLPIPAHPKVVVGPSLIPFLGLLLRVGWPSRSRSDFAQPTRVSPVPPPLSSRSTRGFSGIPVVRGECASFPPFFLQMDIAFGTMLVLME